MPIFCVRRLRQPLAGLIAALSVLAIWLSAPASSAPPPRLPVPTGAHPVGTTSLYLRDTSRADPWVPTVSARELMVSLWYPARKAGGHRAAYLSPTESALVLRGVGLSDVPGDALSRTRTNAWSDAAPAGSRHSLPLVVLSPGFTWPRSSLSSLAEELASRGYVVVGIDHTYETFATTFADGRVTTCAACELEDVDDFGALAVQNRAVDVSFVLDELTGGHSPWAGSALIDARRIAMVGSSLGGAGAGETMLADSRVRAGVNLDGGQFVPLPVSGLSRPFMFIGQEAFHRPGSVDDPSWDRDWARLTGWKRWLVVSGSVHASFTDYDMLGREIGVDLGSTLNGARSVQITRRYVRAFLDQHLRQLPQPLLEQASPRYREVKFCHPPSTTCR